MSIKDNIMDILSLKRRFKIINNFKGQNQGQFVLDKILFDWKTAPWYNYLDSNMLFFAQQPHDCFNPSQLFSFWKQLNQNQTAVQYVQKMQTLISKMKTTEIEHE